MKTKKDVMKKAVEKKSAKKRRTAVKSQVKAGTFWSDLKEVYAPASDRTELSV